MSREERKKEQQNRGEYRVGEVNFDLFIASPNQLQTRWIALTLISFCSISSLVPLSSSRLFGILNFAKQKVPSDTEEESKKASIFKFGLQAVGEGDLIQRHQKTCLLFPFHSDGSFVTAAIM